ncbi:MAG: hypothetical protein FWD93_05065 [Coriobacteriia bacterium]|nr:hypothetical protein [Coriobacteriia bacterium]
MGTKVSKVAVLLVLLLAVLMLACNHPNQPAVTHTIEGGVSLQEIRDWRPDFDELTWFETIEEAVANNEISKWHDAVTEDDTFNEIDEHVALFEGEERFILFFRARNALGSDVIVRYLGWLKSVEETVYYSAVVGGGGTSWDFFKDSVRRHRLDEVGEVRFNVAQFNTSQLHSVDDKTFIWGLSQTSRIHTMQIEGQSPTNIIPVQLDGEAAYFWYFEDLQTDKPLGFQDLREYVEGDLVITMDD